MKTQDITNFIQSANINFLIGSGLSVPYLCTLKEIESHLTKLSTQTQLIKDVIKLVKASLYSEYFSKIILPNKKFDNTVALSVLSEYQNFVNVWNSIIHNRCGNLRSKQINIFTTNIDIFLERATELCNVEMNDGFNGSINPIFNESNFQKTIIKNSIHFQNSTELPAFNILKMHGSINWKKDKVGIIHNDYNLSLIRNIEKEYVKIKEKAFITYNENLEEMIDLAQKKCAAGFKCDILNDFLEAYEKLVIINPTKRKFSETVTDVHFYELMRLFSNSLEKENTLLFVMGFSFADEHILNITKRALLTNPTLLIIIFAHDNAAYQSYEKMFDSVCNVKIIDSNQYNIDNDIKGRHVVKNFDFRTINSVYSKILEQIPIRFDYGN